MDRTKAYIVDIETYPNCFLVAVVRADGKFNNVLEVSSRKNEIDRIFKLLNYIAEQDAYMVTFNGIGFDEPVLFDMCKAKNRLPKTGEAIALKAYEFAQKQIDSFKGEGFGRTIKSEERLFKQLDLYRIWHFNNKAKATSLKLLEFNMRMQSIEDLPFKVGQVLTDEEIQVLVDYNQHDIEATLRFFEESQQQIDFRLDLSSKYNRDWNNCDDTKIGAEYFAMRLEEEGIALKHYKDGKLVTKQTKRDKIALKDCLFEYYEFNHPAFQAVKDWFSRQVITETKGAFSDIEDHLLGEVAKYAEMQVKRKKFKGKPSQYEIDMFQNEHPLGWIEEEELKATEYAFDSEGNHIMEYPLLEDGSPDLSKKQKKKRIPKKSYWGCYRVAETLNVVVDNLRIDFGTGGIHASLQNKIARENKKYFLVDADVSSMYPNIAISNRVYPEHLGEEFCSIYKDVYEQRKSYAKGTAENGMLKLALNGVYGKSNDKYSVFYDPMFTMKITINGQLSLAMLADKLLQIEGLRLVQLNTDGVTVACPRDNEADYYRVCKEWQEQVKLELEFALYSKMFISDVNSYIALYTNGKVKRKGRYQYEDLGWHQNQSCLVVPKAAEAFMISGTPIEEFIRSHKDEFDFMLRTKVPRSSKLVLVFDEEEVEQQNICRYYPSTSGGKLVKIMPPLEGETEDRRLSIDAMWNVKTCNNMKDFSWDDIDYNYYIEEAKKLVIE